MNTGCVVGHSVPEIRKRGWHTSAVGATAMTAARSLRSGMTSVNSVLGFAIVPALPFGGVGESGFGRIHGADGLREFTRPKAITRQRMRPLINLTSFGRTDRDMRRIVTLVTLLHGRLYRPRWRRAPGALGSLGRPSARARRAL